MASAGTGGVEPGFMKPWDYIVTTGLSIRGLESAARPIGRINLWVKLAGKPGARNWHAGFDEAGDGNQEMVGLVRHSQRKRGETDRLRLNLRRHSLTLLVRLGLEEVQSKSAGQSLPRA